MFLIDCKEEYFFLNKLKLKLRFKNIYISFNNEHFRICLNVMICLLEKTTVAYIKALKANAALNLFTYT